MVVDGMVLHLLHLLLELQTLAAVAAVLVHEMDRVQKQAQMVVQV